MDKQTRIIVTERDQQIIRLCHDYVYVDGHYLKNTIFYNQRKMQPIAVSTINRRLQTLVKTGYLDRFLRVNTLFSPRDTIYTLGIRGEQYMRTTYGSNEYSSSWRNYLRDWYNHALTNLRIVEGMKKQMEGHSNYAFQEFIPEARSFFQYGEGKRDVIRPDGLLIIGGRENPANNISLLMETENSIGKYRSIKAKLMRYGDVLCSNTRKQRYSDRLMVEYPVGNFVPLFITSERVSPTLLKEKLLRIKQELSEQPTNVFRSQNVLLTTQRELSENCFGKIFYNLSSEEPEEKRALFKSEGGHET